MQPRNSGVSVHSRARLTPWIVAVLFIFLSQASSAGQRFLIEGIFDAEIYKTGAHSQLLSRNHGDIATLGRLQLWSAFQISAGLQIYGLAELESDNSSGHRKTEAEIEQFALRYTSQSSPYFFLEAGKILSPLAAFSNRHLSTVNPLIRQPYIFSTTYPRGVQLAGAFDWFDYRAALLDLPDFNSDFLGFEPGSALRPAVGFGVTPKVGLRMGVTFTKGPYLNRELESSLPVMTSWRDYKQKVLGFDFQYSRGYLEISGQMVKTRLDVPFQDKRTNDSSYYLELKYTWTPRFYSAARYGDYRADFFNHSDDMPWTVFNRKFQDLEVGLGYRFSANTLFKVSYSRDSWDAAKPSVHPLQKGRSLALQLSFNFDLGSKLASQP